MNIMHLIFGVAGPFHGEVRTNAFRVHIQCLMRLVGTHRALNSLEAHLATRSSGYVASDTLTLADLVVAGVILNARRMSLGIAEVAQYPNVFAHYAKVTKDERVRQLWAWIGVTGRYQ